MRLLITALLLSTMLAVPAWARSEEVCFARVRPESTMVRMIYDPFENLRKTDEVQLNFTPRKKGCAFGLAIGGLGSTNQRVLAGNGRTLNYELQIRGANVANTLNQPSVSISPNPGKGPPYTTADVDSPSELLKVLLPAAQFAPAGSYRDNVTVRMFRFVNGVPYQVGDDQLLSIVVDIPPRAQINLAGISGTGIHFGQLTKGAERDAYLQVRATAPVILTLSSEHRSQLRHKVEKLAVPSVPYHLSVDGQPVDLRDGPQRIDRAPSGGLAADRYRMVVRVMDVNGRIAGDYSDVVTVTVEPK